MVKRDSLGKRAGVLSGLMLVLGAWFSIMPAFSQIQKQVPSLPKTEKEVPMKVAVWDTYVKRPDGRIMHFDIIVPDGTPQEKVYSFGLEYLRSKGLSKSTLTQKESRYCHSEMARSEVQKAISEKGYYIFEMENCD